MRHKHQRLGQNFLKFPEIAEKIVRAGKLKKDDLVVEVGPGFGILTERLAKHAGKVIAIEIDRTLETKLRENLAEYSNIELVFADALRYQPPSKPYLLIANLPYAITSPLINHFLKDQFMENGNPPLRCVLMVQKEVAKKICAKPNDINVLALNIQTFGKPRMLFTVGKGAFSPQPKVDSAVIEIEILREKNYDPKFLKKYFSIISAAFSQKRKTLGNSLKKLFGGKTETILEKAGIRTERRPETLLMEEWRELAKN